MTIGGITTNISTSNVSNDIQVAMLKKSLDTVANTGSELTKMMEASVTPSVGQNFDISI